MKVKFGKWYTYLTTKNGWHFCPFNFIKTKEYRYWGYLPMFYDGEKYTFGFWYFNISWGYV